MASIRTPARRRRTRALRATTATALVAALTVGLQDPSGAVAPAEGPVAPVGTVTATSPAWVSPSASRSRLAGTNRALAQEPITVINDNGGWCWYQDQRAIFTSDDRLLVGTVPTPDGANPAGRAGTVEMTTYDLRTGGRAVERVQTGFSTDDHNAPAFLELPSGRVLSAWSDHGKQQLVHVAHQDPTDLAWTIPAPVTATAGSAAASYSNLIRLSAENGGQGRVYDFFRGEAAGPNLLTSDDGGTTWQRAGRLLTGEPMGTGRQRPYLRYATNGTDRVDFIASTGNPDEYDGTSVAAGYYQGGVVHNSLGVPLGPADGRVTWDQLTPVLAGTKAPPGSPRRSDTDVWTADLEEGPSGPVGVLTTRLPTAPTGGAAVGRYDHRYEYVRKTALGWQVHEIAYGGGELYGAQPDYTGNITIDPSDVDRVVISTNVDPVAGTPLVSATDHQVHWELFEGITADGGSSWTWSPITKDSKVDNLRPNLVAGTNGQWALLWMRGTYTTYQRYDVQLVGIIRANPSGVPRATPTTVAGTTKLAGGRFVGGTRGSLFVLKPGAAPDGYLIQASPRWRYLAHPVVADYAPLAADTDGDGRDELLLVDQAGGITYRLVLRSDSTVSQTSWSSPKGRTPVVVDVNGDGRDDILWYGPGSLSDVLWTMLPGGGHKTTSVSVSGTYTPVATDVDGDGRVDIVWHEPSKAQDPVWRFRADGRWDDLRISATGSYAPAGGRFGTSRKGGIAWQSATQPDTVWRFTGPGTAHTSTRNPMPSGPITVVDMDGDGRDDLFFDNPGATPDVTWYAASPPA